MTKTQLEALVDDYLDKHDAAMAAGNARWKSRNTAMPDAEKNDLLNRFIAAYNARGAAFRALRDARQVDRAGRKGCR